MKIFREFAGGFSQNLSSFTRTKILKLHLRGTLIKRKNICKWERWKLLDWPLPSAHHHLNILWMTKTQETETSIPIMEVVTPWALGNDDLSSDKCHGIGSCIPYLPIIAYFPWDSSMFLGAIFLWKYFSKQLSIM